MAEKMTVEKAVEILKMGFHCSQVIVWHTAEDLGLDKKQALKLAAGLGGGCFHGDVCGAVSGAILSLGLKYGYCEANSAEQNAILMDKVGEFEKRFEEKHGSLVCRDLLGVHEFSAAEEAEAMKQEGIEETLKKCATYCADACEILDDMLK